CSHQHYQLHVLTRSLLMTRPPPTSTLFPYTTLFRSIRLSISRPNLTCVSLLVHHFKNSHEASLFLACSIITTAVPVLLTSLRIVDRKSTRLNSSHVKISYAVFCLKKKKIEK